MDSDKDGFVKIKKRDLERLTTEVMQLREFLPQVLSRDLIEMLRKSRVTEYMMDRSEQERQQLRLDCMHLRSRLDAVQSECQREREVGVSLAFLMTGHVTEDVSDRSLLPLIAIISRCFPGDFRGAEEKLVLREQLWASREQLQQQAEFCMGLGAAACTLLWSASSKEDAVKDILADSKMEAFLGLAGQTLESFVNSLDGEEKLEQQDLSSREHQFVLALAGFITNIAAVTCGRDFLSNSAQILLDTLMQLLDVMKPGVCCKLKVLMLMALYNVSISVKGLKYISQSPGLLRLIWSLLQDGDSEVCLHSLRLLQSLLLEEELVVHVVPELLDTLPLPRIRQLSSSRHPALRQAAQEALDDLATLSAAQKARDRGGDAPRQLALCQSGKDPQPSVAFQLGK